MKVFIWHDRVTFVLIEEFDPHLLLVVSLTTRQRKKTGVGCGFCYPSFRAACCRERCFKYRRLLTSSKRNEFFNLGS